MGFLMILIILFMIICALFDEDSIRGPYDKIDLPYL